MDMSSYEDTNPEADYKTSETAKQTYINSAIDSVTEETVTDQVLRKGNSFAAEYWD